MSRIFISYSSKDRSFILHLAEDLKTAGHDIWLDTWEITGRLPYWTEIQAGIESCTHFLFAISPDSIDPQGGASIELFHAAGLPATQRPVIIPIMVRETPYTALPILVSPGRLQIHDFTKYPYDGTLKNVLRALDPHVKPATPPHNTSANVFIPTQEPATNRNSGALRSGLIGAGVTIVVVAVLIVAFNVLNNRPTSTPTTPASAALNGTSSTLPPTATNPPPTWTSAPPSDTPSDMVPIVADTWTPSPQPATNLNTLIVAAQKEGGLNVITLPDDWANYGEIKQTFFSRYNLTKSDLNPDGSSSDEIAAIEANKGINGPQNPDVVDVGLTWTRTAQDASLLLPYKVATWDSIPDALKDPNGYWYGDYYGTMVFEVNTNVVKDVPQDWSDLLKPEYKNMIGLGGDPTKSSQAIHAVWAAAVANGGSLDNPTPGLQFFKKLAQMGNLNTAVVQGNVVANGQIPIALRWDFNAIPDHDQNPQIKIVYPKSGSIASIYAQGISASGPHPNAAKLWEEFLYSDEGQLMFLKAGVRPVRFDDLKQRGAIPSNLLTRFPQANIRVAFPSIDQINTAFTAITGGWPTVVGISIR